MQVLKNERGLSLVELLAALVITTIIGFIAYGILFNGFKTYERVKIEASLRDEADLIMADLVGDLFTLQEDNIDRKYLPQTNSSNYFIRLKDGEEIGFIDGKLVLKDGTQYTIQNKLIQITDETKIVEAKRGQFRISLTLAWTETNQTLTTESEIGIIIDNE